MRWWADAEADLARYYRVDLVDLLRGTLTWRRVAVLLRGLPPESLWAGRIAAAAPAAPPDGDGPQRPWSVSEHLLAAAVDKIATVAYYTGAAVGAKTEPPKPLRRPGQHARRFRLTPQQRAASRRRNLGR